MAQIIKAKPNKDGKVVVRIFRDNYDVTDKLIDGKAFLEIYGQQFQIEAELPKPAAKKPAAKKTTKKNIKVKQAKAKTERVAVEFIESPKED